MNSLLDIGAFPSWPNDMDALFWIHEEGLDGQCVDDYRQALQKSTSAPIKLAIVEGGETMKSWDQLPSLLQVFSRHQLSRHSVVLTTGGGAMSDAVGFAASIWKRGMRVAHVPTSTLAMVDAAWGGKTAFNFEGKKNQLGTFHAPLFVHIDSCWLNTLPERHRRSGLAEVAKHAMLDPNLGWSHLKDWPDWSPTDQSVLRTWTDRMKASAEAKRRIVEEDPFETERRATLNLGHTVGHAVEAHFSTTDVPWLHGEAVALGLRFAIFMASESSTEDFQPLKDWLRRQVPLPSVKWPSAAELWPLMVHDKKNSLTEVREVQWQSWGEVIWPKILEKVTFEATWQSFLRSEMVSPHL